MRGREGLPEQQPLHCWEIWKMSTWPGGIFDIKSNCQKVSHSNRKRRNVGKLWNWSSKKWKLEVLRRGRMSDLPPPRRNEGPRKSVEFRPRAKVVHVDVVGRSRSFEFCSSRPPIGSAGDVPRWRGWFSFFDLFDARVSATNWRRGGGMLRCTMRAIRCKPIRHDGCSWRIFLLEECRVFVCVTVLCSCQVN